MDDKAVAARSVAAAATLRPELNVPIVSCKTNIYDIALHGIHIVIDRTPGASNNRERMLKLTIPQYVLLDILLTIEAYPMKMHRMLHNTCQHRHNNEIKR